ncbi:MAG: substrate-binding domain-containing protein [Anaerolineales bacterium]|nr:substrate-binding domain-containing protein [Anaerolineales bacterium]
MDTAKTRPSIGFLTANINTGASRVLWPGILDAVEEMDVNLITFPGGRLNAQDNFENKRNSIFDLVNPKIIDGIVCWTSALAGVETVTSDEILQFHRKYSTVPTVNLAAPVELSPLVSIDSYYGMQSLVTHLVDVHHFTKMALIRGPEGHPYALERYHAFVDILKDKGLYADPNLITSLRNGEEGDQAMVELLDDRGLVPGEDFQAVVATSDLLAIGALRILVERGIRVPADLALVGFNDIEEGRLVRPPLTSVSLPFYKQGFKAIETITQLLDGEKVSNKVILDSKLLIRQSCGCPSRSINLAANETQPEALGENESYYQRAQICPGGCTSSGVTIPIKRFFPLPRRCMMSSGLGQKPCISWNRL